MLWGRNRSDAPAKRAFEIRLLVVGGGLAQARRYMPDVEGSNGGGKLFGQTKGLQNRDAPGAAAGEVNIGLAATAEGVAQPRHDVAGVQD
jgi:hypothetical protein